MCETQSTGECVDLDRSSGGTYGCWGPGPDTNTPIPIGPVSPQPSGCGNGTCDISETCSNCPSDCGTCYGTIQARAKLISPSDTSCSAVWAGSTFLPSTTFNFTGGTSASEKTQTDGNYVEWQNVTEGERTLTSVPPAGYPLRIACWQRTVTSPTSGTGMSASLGTAGETLSWDLGYTTWTPWFTSDGGGDIYAASTINDLIPAEKYLCNNSVGITPGVVTYGSSYNLSDGSTSTAGWLTNETYAQTDFYQVFYHRFGSPTPTATGDTTLTSQLAGSSDPTNVTPYYYDGNVTISGSTWNIPSGEYVVVLVNGNLNINTPITITSGGFITFIVNGNITVDPSVGVAAASSTPVLEGVYITSPAGTFDTGASTAASSARFVGKGTFIAGSFTLGRDLASYGGNTDVSAELFLYNPQLLLTMPDKMREVPITWQEVAP